MLPAAAMFGSAGRTSVAARLTRTFSTAALTFFIAASRTVIAPVASYCTSLPPPLPRGLAPRETHSAPHIRRVVCASDLHTDYDDNFRWAETVEGDPDALLLVAGDVSHNPDLVRRTLSVLRSKFGEVAYVPGNHDLWVHNDVDTEDDTDGGEERIFDSVDKLAHLLRLCDEEDVRTGPVRVGGSGDSGLWAVPLLSWHHQSFDTEPDIDPDCWAGIPRIERCMTDYRRARWPEPLSAMDDSVAAYVDSANDVLLSGSADDVGSDGAPVMTFSHFLPRIELTPEKRYLLVPTLNKAVGSTFLEERLRRLGSSLHVFGHTHFGWDQSIDGVRYVQAALAYPRERERRGLSLQIGTMAVEERLRPVCVWNVSEGEGSFPEEWLGGYWSERYSQVPRTPEVTHVLAPWVANRFRRLPGGEIEVFERHRSTLESSLR